MKVQESEKAYALMWANAGETIGTLVYRSPEGEEVRTYYAGHLDPRAGDEASLPRFEDFSEALVWMVLNPEKKALVEVGQAKHILKGSYGEPV